MKSKIRKSFELCIVLTVIVTVTLAGCSGGGGSGGSTTPTTLSSDQQLYEHMELKGGASTLTWNMPYGGGNLISGVDYIYSTSTGGLSQSPLTAGPQFEVPVLTSLDSALALPPVAPTRYLRARQVLVRSATDLRRVSYVGSSINVDYLADDGLTVVQTNQFSNFSEVPVSGIMGNAPEELIADVPITDWINANNFSANAQWLAGSFYNKRHGALVGDTVIAEDCTNVYPLVTTTTATTTPCTTGTLDTFFPVVLLGNTTHPNEFDQSTDGSISMIQGVRMWVANAPRPADTTTIQGYRIYYELNGKVYMGILYKDGSPYRYTQADGSVVDYVIALNQAAVSSVEQGLITGASMSGSQAGSDAVVQTVDLFGVGGHGINGSLAPADLVAHYGIPANLNGAGQTIVIVDAPGTGNVTNDLNVFSQYYGLPQCNTANPCFQQIDLSGGTPVPASDDWGSEIALDTQMVHAIAPGANIILVTANGGSYSALISAVNYAAALPNVTAVTMSFGYLGVLPANMQTEDSYLSSFQSANGTVFFAGSGDAGNYALQGVAYPAQSAYVTAVGGTRINSVTWAAGSGSETAWEFSGGGTSSSILMPSWQSSYLTGISSPLVGAYRVLPDVAAVADFQHSAVGIYHKQSWVMSGGTSAASPLWAGISALFAQYLSNKGESLPALVKATPGGFNGLLYQTGVTQGTSAGIYAILSGSNNLTANACSVCTASSGYDAITGLGAPDVSKLFGNF